MITPMRQVAAEVDHYLALLGHRIRARGFTRVEVQDALGWGRVVTSGDLRTTVEAVRYGTRRARVFRVPGWP